MYAEVNIVIPKFIACTCGLKISLFTVYCTHLCGTLVGKLQESEKLHVADEASCMVVFTEQTEMLQVKANFRSC